MTKLQKGKADESASGLRRVWGYEGHVEDTLVADALCLGHGDVHSLVRPGGHSVNHTLDHMCYFLFLLFLFLFFT